MVRLGIARSINLAGFALCACAAYLIPPGSSWDLFCQSAVQESCVESSSWVGYMYGTVGLVFWAEHSWWWFLQSCNNLWLLQRVGLRYFVGIGCVARARI